MTPTRVPSRKAPYHVIRWASVSHCSGVISGSCDSSGGRNSRYHRAAVLITCSALSLSTISNERSVRLFIVPQGGDHEDERSFARLGALFIDHETRGVSPVD